MSSGPFFGQIKLFAGDFAPVGWLKCEGQLLPISEHTALFSLIATTYGGDGRKEFALPDLRGRVPIGATAGPNRLGKKGGSAKAKIEAKHLPPHQHDPVMFVANTVPEKSIPEKNNVRGLIANDVTATAVYQNVFTPATPDVLLHKDSIVSQEVGEGKEISLMKPYTGLHYIICIQGIYPSK